MKIKFQRISEQSDSITKDRKMAKKVAKKAVKTTKKVKKVAKKK